MSAPLSRIGRALLKFFKPIRMTQPHSPGSSVPTAQIASGSSHFNQQKLTVIQLAQKDKNRVIKPGDENLVQVDEGFTLAPPPAKAQWLDLVIYLLAACRKATEKMRRRSGMGSYQQANMNRGKSKLKAVGNIIDTDDKERA